MREKLFVFKLHPSQFRLHSRPWCNGSTADSKPVSQGSNPWGRARKFEVGSSKFERLHRFFLQIDVKIAISSLASAVSGSRRDGVTSPVLASNRSQ